MGVYTEDPRVRCAGITLDGQNPCCPCCPPKSGCYVHEYPTPPKPCPPPKQVCPPNPPRPGCNVNKVQPKNFMNVDYTCTYCPGPCTRPCCLHWKSKEPCCQYDDPCKAHCYNHPIGIKPSGRYPPPYYKGPLPRCCD